MDVRFPILERCIYLNHAAISPWPQAVVDAMGAFVEDNARHGPLRYARWLKIEQRLRGRLAELLNADSPDDIALVKNTSEGLNLIAQGLDWKPGDAVLFPAGEFPSNALPWRALSEQGVEIREVELDADDPSGALISRLDSRARLVAVSSVRYDSGLRLDLTRLGAACHDAGALLCVDAIQEIGALPFDVRVLPVDFVVAGGHKWLLGSEGLAVFWSHPASRERLRPVQFGWRMFPDMFELEREDWSPPRTARRFEPGTLNNAGIQALDAAIGLLLETGMDAVGNAVLDRSRFLIRELSAIPGSRVLTPATTARHAGIVSFQLEAEESRRLVNRLQAAGIYTALRGKAVRLSPHFYTPMEQLERTLDVIHGES